MTKPNGTPLPDWTPAERKVWLVSHNAPAHMLLVTSEEMQAMARSMAQQRQLTDKLSAQYSQISLVLGDYWLRGRDLVESVRACVIDARRAPPAISQTK